MHVPTPIRHVRTYVIVERLTRLTFYQFLKQQPANSSSSAHACEQRGCGDNLVADLSELHSKVAAIKTGVTKHGDKFLEPHIVDSSDQSHKTQLLP